MISCISPGLSHSFNCQGLSHVNWRRLASRLTITPRKAHLCIGCYAGPPVCVCVCFLPLHLSSDPTHPRRCCYPHQTAETDRLWSPPQKTLEPDRPPLVPFFFSFPSAVSVNPHSAARLFNCCLSLTRAQRHSGGLSYSAGATLALKWNDLISQLSIVKDIYKRLRLQAQRYDRWSRGGVVVVGGQSNRVASFGGWEWHVLIMASPFCVS